VRHLTTEATALVGLFDRCYERRPNAFGAPTWHLVALPERGSMADQDARTMEALGFIRDVRNRLEQDRCASATKSRRAAAVEQDEPAVIDG
jgi:hypothetical protein